MTKKKSDLFGDLDEYDDATIMLSIVEILKNIIIDSEEIDITKKKNAIYLYLLYKRHHKKLKEDSKFFEFLMHLLKK